MKNPSKWKWVKVATLEPNIMVTCPVCKGSKKSPFIGICKCCDGAGEITRTKLEALNKIRKDIMGAFADRGLL